IRPPPSSPRLAPGGIAQHLRDTAAGAARGTLRERVSSKEALLHDLEAGLPIPQPLPAAHHEEGDVVAGETLEIGIDAEQLRQAGGPDARLLVELARQRGRGGLSLLDPAAGEMPAGLVAVPHQQDAALRVEDGRLSADGEAAPQAPVTLQHLDQNCVGYHLSLRAPADRRHHSAPGPDLASRQEAA